ncbi:DNA binding protein [Arthrobacter phage CallinAllBarbz]|uniref:DNA binding protein n=1 Tax=Arthrobacter phage CallinAllBarbz TaxID=3077790 RepID=A0AA96HDA6_9CAUD|nr:DNA binding protein [Arthrobacter phage CallinAllBarbz]
MTAFDSVLSDIFDRRLDFPAYSVEDEAALVARAKAGDDDATMALVRAYAQTLRKGVKIASGVAADSRKSSDLDDVKMQAVLGLIEAIHDLDPAVHNRLAAIANDRITRRVAEVAQTSASSFNVPERTLRRFLSIMRAADGNVYEAARLAPTYELSRESFFAILSAVRNVESYDSSFGEEGEDNYLANLDASALYGRVRTDNEIVEDEILVEAAFRAVDGMEEDVVRLAYGFSDYDPVSDAEIAHRMGLSRPKVQRTRAGALGKMRSALGVA